MAANAATMQVASGRGVPVSIDRRTRQRPAVPELADAVKLCLPGAMRGLVASELAL